MNYKAVTNCLTNWLFIEESSRSGEVKNPKCQCNIIINIIIIVVIR